MKTKTLLAFFLSGITGVLLAFAQGVLAQAPAGPVSAPTPGAVPAAKPQEQAPLPPPRPTILGAWKLNRDESDDMRNRSQDSRDSDGGYGRRRGGGGWPGGGGSGRRGSYGGESDEQRQQMHELLNPPAAITFSAIGAEVDLMDDHDRKRAFMTDGRKLKKSKDYNYQEIAAKWDGNRLVTDEKSPHGGKMSRSFELSADGRQLYENLHAESSGRNNRSLDAHFVYDILAEAQKN